mmetsp:Transcript_18723/g.21485  ORF Transcript_18723/g.21485 Transcript_18723/m.21485 type:complete len:1029 (+) Transcript_18723:266-3352(+)
MGFLKKIFRGGRKKNKNINNRNSEALSVPTGASQNRNKGKGGKSAASTTTSSGTDVISGRNESINQTNNNQTNDFRSPRSSSGPIDTDDERIISPNKACSVSNLETDNAAAYYNEARNQTQEQLRIAYENSKRAADNQTAYSGDDRSANDDEPSPGLTSNQLQQWDHHHHHQHQQQQQHPNQLSSTPITPTNGGVSSSSASSQPVYSMSSDLPSQQIVAMDDMDRSDASGSSFNLSTDAEDSEYETMKRTTGSMYYPTGNGLSALDTSAIDTVTSVTSYTTDEDRKIFPNLPTDDEMTLGTEASSKMDPQPPSLLLPLRRNQTSAPDNEPSSIEIYPMSNDPTGNLGVSWTDFNPSKNNSNNVSSNETSKQSSSTKSTGSTSNSRDRRFFNTSATSPLANNNNAQVIGINNAVSNISRTSTTISRNKPGVALRDFTSPKSLTSSNTEFSTNSNIDDGFGSGFETSKNNLDNKKSKDGTGFSDFGNFADFSNFPSTDDIGNQEWTTMKEEKKDQPAWEEGNEFNKKESSSDFDNNGNSNAWIVPSEAAVITKHNSNDNMIESSRDGEGLADPFNASSAVGSSHISGSSSSFQQDTSLSELLEAAKSKRKDRRHTRHSSRTSSSSVNSAPAITASFLRQHHNLGNTNGDDGRFNTGTSYNNDDLTDRDKAAGDGTSVSDIIESLEATDRMKRGENIPHSHRSMGDTGVVATARAAKERLRERRRRERDGNYGGRIPNSLSRESDSDESEGHDASESWLFDQVTGAIGPVGIAADLESLSGRSNRSKNSHGNKSHKSSRRRSRKASSRRHRSDRSVDSHGSRASRYSHRSTKSFLSQMSEQSRSVANDLLRLEMQLAMVGSNDKRDDGVQPRAGSSSASLGGASRGATRSSSRKASSRGTALSVTSSSSSSIARRSKTTVVAPPGKLGIILANKADSKGTVVSGVRTSSVLVDRISPGDRIVAIDGEDVSRMTVSEITTIMSRKAEYERRLTVLTIPKSAISSNSEGGLRSPSRVSPRGEFENNFTSNYRR